MKKKKPVRRTAGEGAGFNPELDGLGRVLSPVRAKHLPPRSHLESALAQELRTKLERIA